ncbi:DUF2510 domain-containing protein [Arthrobacter sp. efr-133-TYG-104]|uniref:DUF2510 domain-containing protein n=1 Tax=Arthrobacter sp. efr-133-TYG-104 TaxID=3040324 RepID=UPI00254DFE9C|nr:DUF2510 domain-containing protein [Arthrobacter sp. efr-133-TYG-104]
MTQPMPGSTTPAGWYPDPADPRQVRWWDGQAWTAHLRPAAPQPGQFQPGPYQQPGQFQQGPYPQGQFQPGQYHQGPYQPARYVQPRTQLSEQTPVYNPFIWVITFLPLVSVLLLSTWQPQFRYITTRQGVHTIDPLSMYTPGYFVTLIFGLLAWGLMVFLAYLDHQRLLKIGVVRPFHWAWAFLNGAVYVVGRSVIVHKVAPKRGLLPVWALIAVYVVDMVAVSIWVSTMLHSMMAAMGYSVAA